MKIEYRHLNWMQLIWDTKLTTNAKAIAAIIDTSVAGQEIDFSKTGLDQAEIVSGFSELTDAGWLVEEGETYHLATPGGKI